MIVIIPRKLVMSITFPGVILHEVAHQFMCDLCNVPIYSVQYFMPDSEEAIGRVTHAPISSYHKELCIGIAPLFINSLVCMLLTIPIGTALLFGTTFLGVGMGPVQFFIAWIGVSSGFHAMPSKQDMRELSEIATTPCQKRIALVLQTIVGVCNVPNLDFAINFAYTCLISLAIPFLFFR